MHYTFHSILSILRYTYFRPILGVYQLGLILRLQYCKEHFKYQTVELKVWRDFCVRRIGRIQEIPPINHHCVGVSLSVVTSVSLPWGDHRGHQLITHVRTIASTFTMSPCVTPLWVLFVFVILTLGWRWRVGYRHGHWSWCMCIAIIVHLYTMI